MIYSASLGSAVKKSQKDKAHITQIPKICNLMPIEPEVSGMDAVILGPRDVVGVNQAKVQQAIDAHHPDLCIIYIYIKDNDKNLIRCENVKQVKKFDDKAIDAVVQEFLSAHLIRAGKLDVTSQDFRIREGATAAKKKVGAKHSAVEEVEEEEQAGVVVMKGKNIGDADVPQSDNIFGYDENGNPITTPPGEENFTPEFVLPPTDGSVIPGDVAVPGEYVQTPPMPSANVPGSEMTTPGAEMLPLGVVPGTAMYPNADQQPYTTQSVNEYNPSAPIAPVGANIAAIRDFGDFDLLKKAISKDKVIAEVLSENASYKQIEQMLEVLDKNIQTIFLDTSLTPEERYQRLSNAGLQRADFTAQKNEIIITKTKAIFDKTTSIVEEFVTSKVSSMEKALTKITLDKKEFENRSIDIEKLIEERTNMEMDLLRIMRELIDVYKTMDALTTEELTELDKDLPSSNEFVNSVLAPSKELFTPSNTGDLVTSIMESMQSHRATLSGLETKIRTVINVIFSICEQNDMIIQYQANLIRLLKSNKVEDVVVVDTALKGVLRLYVGAEDTGTTATILTQSGLQSRASNTLIVDVSGSGKWEDYGMNPYTWDEFISMRPHEDLCVVTCDASDPEKVHDMIKGIKNSLDHYRYVNIKLDYTQTDVMSQICDDAIVVHFITDCRSSNVRRVSKAVNATWSTNIAKKAILIDPPTNEIPNIITAMGLDILTTKMIPIPHLTQMKGCAITRKHPWENDEVATAFEGAFR